MHPINKISVSGVVFAALLACAIPAHAQLSMSYKLDVRSDRAEQQADVVSRCAGVNWMTSIGACGRELFTRIASGVRAEGSAMLEPAAAFVAELPELGGTARDLRIFRPGGGREALLATSKTADLLLRLGSKYRVRSSEEGGWEYYRFTDANYESHVKANAHKAVGVELLVPFQ